MTVGRSKIDPRKKRTRDELLAALFKLALLQTSPGSIADAAARCDPPARTLVRI
jgi:hypothetical protein